MGIGSRKVGTSALASLLSLGGAFAAFVSVAPKAAAAAPFVVTSTGDQFDQATNGACSTSVGTCTLRAAMQEANARAGHDTIEFAIAGTGTKEIAPATRLPILTDAAGVTIDGYTQSGASPNTDPVASNAVLRVQLRGTGATGIDGIMITAPNSIIRGLAFYNFRRAIYLYGPGAHDNVVVGNFVGTDATATFVSPTVTIGSSGVLIQAGAHDNIVGEPGDANRNVLSGNAQHGVATYDNDTDNNVIQNNIIGLRPDGGGALGNLNHGVDINTWSSSTMIGGTGFEERNVIGGNHGEGVEISHGRGTLDNKVIGNYIGTNLTATAAPAFARNGHNGVNLEGWASCDDSCPSDAGFNTVTNNVIVNNGHGGVLIAKGVHDSVVADNLIGVLPSGAPAPNGIWGARVEKGSFANTIGPGNVIAYNPNGIQLVPTGSSPASNTPVATYHNTFTRNSIHDTSGLGIDLAPLGSVTAAPGSLVNDGVRLPTITSATPAAVTVSTCANCTVELFVSDRPADQFGPGATFVGSAVANGSGTATIPVSAAQQGMPVTAVTTNTVGDTSEFSKNVAVPTGTPVSTLVDDGFDRSVSGGWGSAPTGGAWTVTSGSASDFSVGSSAGSVVLRAAATGGGARLLGVSSRDVELEGVVRSSAASSGFGQQVSLVARRVRNNREYRVRVRFAANGQVFVGVFKMLGTGTEVAVGPEVLVGGTTFSPGVNYRVRARFLGASPTTITTSVWVDGQAAPGSWQLTRTDSESLLQAAGATGLHTVLSSTATVVPVTFSFGSFSVEQATAAPT